LALWFVKIISRGSKFLMYGETYRARTFEDRAG
jgi:hypothetical protein